MSTPDDPGAVPGWADFLDPDEFADLVALIRERLGREGRPFELDPEAGVVHLPAEGDEARTLGLLNLLQTCRQHERSDWPAIVADHFDRMMRIGAQHEEIDRLGDDFEAASSMLKVRLFADEVPGREDSLVFRRPMPGVLATLVYDLPEAIATVHPEHAVNWAKHGDELFRIGLENVRDQDPVEVDELDLGGASALVLVGESYFSATHALLIEDYLPADADPSRGALVAVPHRHVVLVHVIRDESVIPAVNGFLVAARGMHHEGPGSISPDLFWWHDGGFTLLPADVDGDEVTFRPPGAFFEMLNNLVPDSE